MLAVTRVLAMDMMENPYITVGDFIKTLTDHDLCALSDIAENGTNDPRFEEILLISEMLAAGEGVSERNIDTMVDRTKMFMMYLTCESLFRKGLVDIFHDKMSFGEDAANEVIVKKKD